MRISPVSFGKAVRVNGSISAAYDITRLANEKKASNAEKSAQKQVKAIFDDVTNEAPARVVSYHSNYNQIENVFVVSGKEAIQADKLYEKMIVGIIDAGNNTNSEKRNGQYRSILNQYNDELKTFLTEAEENFQIRPTYNEKEKAIKSINKEYPKVYAVAGTKKQIEELGDILRSSAGSLGMFKATSLYRDRDGEGLCTDAAKEGKEIYFVVTDSKTNNKISFMEHGWTSINGISQHIERFIELDDVKEQATSLQDAMESQI